MMLEASQRGSESYAEDAASTTETSLSQEQSYAQIIEGLLHSRIRAS